VSAHSFELAFAQSEGPVRLRELRGHDEHAIEDRSTAAALGLLDGLLVDAPRGGAAGLTACDRDRLLATVYAHTYGPRVQSSPSCRRCEAAFDVDFDLRQLMDAARPPREPRLSRRLGGNLLELSDGRRVRVPTAEDELAVESLPLDRAEHALLERCVVDGHDAEPADDLDAALEEAAPALDQTLDARCPECGEEQQLRFDIQSYLLGALLQERDRLDRDVHRLARAYGWTLADILNLPRSRRRAYVALVEGERATREVAL
jgi:hypothetical protein